VNQMINHMNSVDTLYYRTMDTSEKQKPLVSHSVNVAIYAIKIGIGMKYEREQLIQLGIGALLHDIGMAKVSEEIVNKNGKLTEKEFVHVKKHPQYGYKLLLSLGKEYEWLAEIALQEHEREGGQGYPRGLSGDDIIDHAKIIGLVSTYEALTHQRPYRNRFLPYDAIKKIIEEQRGFFASHIVRAMLTQLSVFPVNSCVRLNSNVIGKVVETTKDHPLRPTIQLLYDFQGRKVQNKKIIKLQDSPLLYIKDTLFENDLPQ
ncbi:MAG: HD-GYP domain-containing protein, partial [Thermodesulfobacteriota bacterium]|nr:HD-GYP domain-containing protein [Thermodesulfobacteriota bacterium]